MNTKPYVRIAVSGGPGGGKTTAVDLFQRELGESIIVIPESATLLFSGGFPRYTDPESIRCTQTSIYHVQRNMEELFFYKFKRQISLCDRGTLDGAAYWPGPLSDFLVSLETTLEEELARYDAVVFFETAAAGGLSTETGNIYRKETSAEALELDRKLQAIWRHHPNFVFIPHQESFLHKIHKGLEALLTTMQSARTRNGAK